MRLARFLARCGVASRRGAEEIISAGRVSVNGEVAVDLGRQVRPGEDRVQVDGVEVLLAAEELTLLHHKPPGVLVSRSDPHHTGHTVYDLLPGEFAAQKDRLVYAGRLDRDSEGLLLLSTDGNLINGLTHPRFHVEKEYLVTVDRALSLDEVKKLSEGVELDDGPTHPCLVERLRDNRVRMVLKEGRNRQIRRMMTVLGRRVIRLVRCRIGELTLGDLKEGAFREILPAELKALSEAVGQAD